MARLIVLLSCAVGAASFSTTPRLIVLLSSAVGAASFFTTPAFPPKPRVVNQNHAPRARGAFNILSRKPSEPPRPGSLKAATQLLGDTPYGESSRKYRRTFYTHKDWVKHRSPIRQLRNLKGTFTSGVVRNLLAEVGAVLAVTLFTIAWNSAFFGYQGFDGLEHAPPFGQLPAWLQISLPAMPFQLASSALGLLLVFRTNTSYGRWLEARMAWGRIVSHNRNLLRQSAQWIVGDEAVRHDHLSRLGLCSWAFARSLQVHLSSPACEEAFAEELRSRLCPDAAQALLAAPHRPMRALFDLGAAVDGLPVDEKKRVEMDKSVIIIGDACEVCERIFASPVPLVYTRHTARFLATYLLLLPLALWESFGASWNHMAEVPAMALLSIFLFGIEELAVQLEEPFSILPLDRLCSGLLETADDALVWGAGSASGLAGRKGGEKR